MAGVDYNVGLQLINQAFKSLNNYKRNRILSVDATGENLLRTELRMYQDIDSLELTIRAIQKEFLSVKYANNGSKDIEEEVE